MDEERGTANGWDSMWGRFVERVLKETKVTERFTEHDLRASASWVSFAGKRSRVPERVTQNSPRSNVSVGTHGVLPERIQWLPPASYGG